MADLDDWSANANEVINLSFVHAGSTVPLALSTFNPKFTYPIFGEEERIFGYQGLQITLRFAAHDLLPNVEIGYERRFKKVGETEATQIEGVLKEWVPEITFQKTTDFYSSIQNDSAARDFRPPGERIDTYISGGRNFEVWTGELTDPAIQKLIERIQIMISFFIEGGTPLPLDDHDWSLARWRVFFLYEKLSDLPSPNTSPYSLVGYSTTYRFITYNDYAIKTSDPPPTFSLPPSTPLPPSSLPSRARISQFLIFPPHQSHSHGIHLLTAQTRIFLSDPTISEITVEDPNEAFDDLRDVVDYTRLTKNNTFAQISLPTSLPPTLFTKKPGIRVPTSHLLPPDLLDKLRTTNKLAPRQFARLLEMHLLSTIPPAVRQSGTSRLTQKARSKGEEERKWYYWRLLCKQRIYKRNRDVLAQLERAERVEKVEQAVGEQAGDYERVLRKIGRVVEREREAEGSGGVGNGNGEERRERERGKRKVVLEDEDEEMQGTPEPKRRG